MFKSKAPTAIERRQRARPGALSLSALLLVDSLPASLARCLLSSSPTCVCFHGAHAPRPLPAVPGMVGGGDEVEGTS